MNKNIDVFGVHDRIMEDYKSFISSFLNIRDKAIRDNVESEIEAGRFSVIADVALIQGPSQPSP